MANSVKFDRYLVPATGKASTWIATMGAVWGIAVSYFLVAQLGLTLIPQPSDVAVFWPASGLAAGVLIISGRRAFPALVIGVVVGTIAANLLSDRSLLTATLEGLCNAGGAALAAWLLGRWFGRPFAFSDLHRVGGFLAAAGLATATSAIGGAATMTLFHTATPFWEVWRAWFLSDGVGIVVVAPLVIGLDQLWREPPSRRESIEAVGVLALLALARLYTIDYPSDSWLSFNPAIVVLPPLVWLLVRCPPAFAIAGAFVVSTLIIGATTYGIGRFGDAAVPIIERVKGAQALVATGTIFVLVLVALFAERRRSETELKQSNNRLQLALDCAELGTWSLHLNTGCFENDVRDRRIHGHGQPPQTLAQMRSQVHPDDLSKLDTVFMALGHTSGSCRTEYRLAPRTHQERAGRERWVAMEGTVVHRARGRPVQLLGVTRDITERKRAEERQRVLVAELDHRVKNTLATVSAVVSQTRQGSRSVPEFAAALEGRLRSMAATHELLGARWWQGVSLTVLVRRELAPYAARNNTELSGPEVVLRTEAGQAMAMVLHELATNAAKYGALSSKKGRVSIRWNRRLNGHPPRLVLEWQEMGGPPIIAPGTPSYGSSTIRDLIPYEFGGTVDLVFALEGLQCRVELPADWLSDGADPVSESPRAPSEAGTPESCRLWIK